MHLYMSLGETREGLQSVRTLVSISPRRACPSMDHAQLSQASEPSSMFDFLATYEYSYALDWVGETGFAGICHPSS